MLSCGCAFSHARLGASVQQSWHLFVSSVFLSLKSHTYSIHEISSMFGFLTENKNKIIPHKTKKSSKQWWWALVTVHKESPDFCGDPCLVCSKASRPPDFYLLCSKMVDVNTEAPWCNGSKERSDCKKSWDTVGHFSHLDDPAEVSPLVTDTNLLGHFLNTPRYFFITVVTWFWDFTHETNWSLRYVLLLSSPQPLTVEPSLRAGSYVMYTLIVGVFFPHKLCISLV